MTTRTAADEATRPAATRRSGRPGGSTWRVPAALLLLSAIPVVAGSLRVLDVLGGPSLLPANPRIDASPVPLVLHVVAAAVFAVVGAFQFSARLRRRRPGWHRGAGRVLVVAGLVVALSGLWLAVFHPGAPGGAVAWGARLAAGSATAISITLGFAAIRRRDITAHRAWMIRAYALSLGAGTQAFTEGIAEGAVGAGDLSKALGLSSGWLINAAVAEWVIRRRPARTAPRVRTRAALAGSR
jgi:uncharacterized membrane protein